MKFRSRTPVLSFRIVYVPPPSPPGLWRCDSSVELRGSVCCRDAVGGERHRLAPPESPRGAGRAPVTAGDRSAAWRRRCEAVGGRCTPLSSRAAVAADAAAAPDDVWSTDHGGETSSSHLTSLDLTSLGLTSLGLISPH